MSGSARRLEPQQLVAKVRPDSPVLAVLFRVLVGLFAGWLTLGALNWLGLWSLPVALLATGVAIWRTDGAGVHDLLSGLSSQLTKGLAVPVRPGDRISTVRAGDLRAGDLVCPADEFEKRMAEHDQRVARQAARAQRNAARRAAYEHRRRRAAGNRQPEPPPPAPYRAVSLTPPRIRYREVVAVRGERNGALLRIGLAPAEIIPKKPDDDMLIRPRAAPVSKPDSEPAARALEAMLVALRHRTTPVPERDLIEELFGEPRPGVRHAVRAAVAYGLIARQTGFRRAVRRLVRVLTSGPSADWNGEDAHLTLTELGCLWVDAATAPEDPPAGGHAVTIVQTFIVGDHNHVDQTVGTRAEYELAAIRELLTTLAAQRTAMSRDVADAVRTLEQAASRGRADTTALRTVLQNLSHEVLRGLLSNTVYDVLKHLAGLDS
jgi:hypothetical protein